MRAREREADRCRVQPLPPPRPATTTTTMPRPQQHQQQQQHPQRLPRPPPLAEEEEEEEQEDYSDARRRPPPHTTTADSASASLAQVLSSPPRALALFAADDFDPDAFIAEAFGRLTERGIENARRDLAGLLRATGDAVADAATEHHSAFLELCHGAEELREGVRLLRNYASGASALASKLRADLKPLHSLTRRALAPPKTRRGRRREGSDGGEGEEDEEEDDDEDDNDDDDDDNDQQSTAAAALDPTAGAGAAAAAATAAAAAAAMQGFGGGKLSERARRIEQDLTALLRRLDAAVAQRDVARALAALAAGDDAAAALDRDAGALALEVEDLPAWRYHFEASLAARRRTLTRALERQLEDGGAAGPEARAAARALAALAGDGPAASTVLRCHSARLRAAAALQLRAQASLSAADPDGLEYAGALVQGALAEVGAAADALAAVFGARSPAAAAAFSVWSVQEARACAALLRRHALAQQQGGSASGLAGAVATTTTTTTPSPSTTTTTPELLAPAARALSVALVFCAVLEHSHQVSLGAVFERALLPDVEAALRRRLARLADESAVAAAEEGEALVMARLMAAAGGDGATNSVLQVELVTASGLVAELASAARLLAPLLGRAPSLAAALRQGAVAAFDRYARAALRPLRAHAGFSPEDQPRLAPLLPALLEALAGVADALAPAMRAPLGGGGGGESGGGGGEESVVDVSRALDAALAAAYGQAQAAMRAAAAKSSKGGGV